MKILLISNGYPPRHWAGTETYTAGIAKELSQRGYQIQVLCVGDWQTGENYLNGHTDDLHQGIPVRRINLNWMKAPDPFRYLYDNPVTAELLSGYLDEFRPDLVHVTSCETLSASVLKVVKDARLPLVLSLTDFWFLCPRINLLRSDGELCDGRTTEWDCLRCQMRDSKAYRWPSKILPQGIVAPLLTAVSKQPFLTRQRGLRGLAGDMAGRKAYLKKALAWPGCRITASRFVRDVFEANGVNEPIRVQPYGHDLGWLEQYHGKTPSDKIRFGYIGQIHESKGIHLLLEATLSLMEISDRFEVLVYGNMKKDPYYSARLYELAEKAGNVSFCGTYAHEDSGRVYSGIDVLVVPSVWYDFPLIIHEAFAAQSPVIATNLGSISENVLPEVNGLLFERGDVAGLAHQMRRVVEEPDLLEGLRARILPVKRTAEEVTEIEGVYRELVKQAV